MPDIERQRIVADWNPPNFAEIERNAIERQAFGGRNNMRNGINPYGILDGCGIELETTNIDANKLRMRNGDFRLDHDASIESDAYVNPGDLPLYMDLSEGNSSFPKQRIGTEFVSTILNLGDSNKIFDQIYSLVEMLAENGEEECSQRAGIHYHIASAMNKELLIKSVYITRHLEQVFYYLGGMGYEFRGVSNNFAYCRPITKFGPPIYNYDGTYYQTFTTDDLIKSSSYENFFLRYGGINVNNPPGKYYPVRYNWFTWFPLLSKGTVEFRVFNKTLNPMKIFSTLYFSQFVVRSFYEKCSVSDLPENSIYDKVEKGRVIDTMLNFIEGKLPTTIVDNLVFNIEQTPEIIVEPEYCFSHLDGKYRIDPSVHTFYKLPRGTKVSKPKIVDIHVLRGEV